MPEPRYRIHVSFVIDLTEEVDPATFIMLNKPKIQEDFNAKYVQMDYVDHPQYVKALRRATIDRLLKEQAEKDA